MKRVWGIAACCLMFLTACGKEETPQQTLQAYIQAWNEQKFDQMYKQLSSQSKTDISQEEFVSRYEKIYNGIEAVNIKVAAVESKGEQVDKQETADLLYSVQMDTLAGQIVFEHKAALVREKVGKEEVWKINWNPSLIFPTMKEDDKVRVTTYEAKRGEIISKNGVGLAVNGTAMQVGIVPEKLGSSAETTKETLAKLLGITIEDINSKLQAKWVQPHHFVPLAILSDDAKLTDYSSLPGVTTQSISMRTYPLKEAAAHVTGYIREVSAEDIKKLEGYKAGDVVGKAGLEQVYEEELRGENGGRIYITDANNNEKTELANQAAKDGNTIVVTIDSKLQQSLYQEMNGDAGSAAAVDPNTGNVLALVSSPAYDPNAFVRGVQTSQWEGWNNDPNKPLLNRFTKAYAPGSVFKPITAAIGMHTRTLDPAENIEISGVRWAKDSSWGNYYVTRVKEISPVNLERAMLYSDNIYFAQAGIRIGKQAFVDEAQKFGFGEKLPLMYPFQESKLATKEIETDIQLADSAYGQGEVVMTPLHIALAYAPIVTGGTIPAPSLQEGENANGVWKEGVMTAETAKLLQGSLIQVVNHPDGTGKSAKLDGAVLAGKTGTAELKQEKGGAGQENGWFVAYNTTAPTMIIAMMIEDVKTRGGSSYVAAKVKQVFEKTIQ